MSTNQQATAIAIETCNNPNCIEHDILDTKPCADCTRELAACGTCGRTKAEGCLCGAYATKPKPNGTATQTAKTSPCKGCGTQPAGVPGNMKSPWCKTCIKGKHRLTPAARRAELSNKGKPCPTPGCGFLIAGPTDEKCLTCLHEDAKGVARTKAKALRQEGEVGLGSGPKSDGSHVALNVVTADTVTTERVDWLWLGRIPAAKITLFSGKGDCGKSTVLLDIVARVTTGADFPDGAKNAAGPRKVLMLVSEDDPNDTVVPKLQAAGADTSMVSFVTKVTVVGGEKDGRRGFQLREDLKLIAKALADNPEYAMVAFDPLSGFLGAGDSNADKDMRPLMEQLQETCARTKTAVVGIVHHNKKVELDSVQRIGGAGSIGNVTRAIWNFSADKETDGEYYMSKAKGNLAKKGLGGMKYKIVDAEVTLSDGTTDTKPRIEWLGAHSLTADDVSAIDKAAAANPRDTKCEAAKMLLLSMLDAPRRSPEIYEAGRKELIGERTMKDAIKELGIHHNKRDGWWMSLPPNCGIGCKLCGTAAKPAIDEVMKDEEAL